MLEALIVAVIYICIICVVAWLLTVLVGAIPMPPPFKAIIPTAIWVVAAIIALVVLLNVVRGTVPSLP